MDALRGYDSDDEKPSGPVETKSAPTVSTVISAAPSVNAAPHVDSDLSSKEHFVDPTTSKIFYNPTAVSLFQPLAGPNRPGQAGGDLSSQGVPKNAVTGWFQPTHFDEAVFHQQYHTYTAYGYANDPATAEGVLIGDINKAVQNQGEFIFNQSGTAKSKKELKAEKKKRKLEYGDVGDLDAFKGPWAPTEDILRMEKEIAEYKPTAEQEAYAEEHQKKRQKPEKKVEVGVEGPETALPPSNESSTFHGEEETDSLGRSWMAAPSEMRPSVPEKCFVPKKCLHTWRGHTKGVNAIQFFPGTAHLLISASMDSTVKIWQVNGQRKCLRTYEGHDEAVRSVCFNSDGTKFLTGSYDKWVKYWDTETGQCISRVTTKKLPYCAVLHPGDDRGHQALVGQADKKIVQWDFRTGNRTQTYDEHLGPVNSITFIDNNRRFVSSGDDKKILIWEFGIPVVIKHLSEPDYHSMPSIAVHPDGKMFAAQSQDNQILVFDCWNRFKMNRKKRFVGHLTAGYACQVNFSPDGSLVMSGDAEGRLFIWNWKTHQLYKKMKAHDKVTIGAVWNPNEPSRVATCSWDGTIKYWD